jgi:hypothetical protein
MAARKATAKKPTARERAGAGRRGFSRPDRDRGMDYDGVHVFVFVDHVERDDPTNGLSRAIDALEGVEEVRFAARMLGPYAVFAHLRTDDLGAMLDLIDGPLWERGIRCSYANERSVTVTPAGKKGTKRDSPGVIGLTKIWMEPSGAIDDDVEDLLQSLPKYVGPTFKGASSVAGDFDILLQLGHDSDVEVVLYAASQVRRIPGVARTETALTQLED